MKTGINWAILAITVVAVVIFRFDLLSKDQVLEATITSPSPSPTSEQLAEYGWMTGCIKHTLEEAQRMTDVVIDERVATSKARVFCQCDWDYLRNNLGLSFEDIADVAEAGSRGSRGIAEAQNYCYEQHKGDYYQ